MLSRHPVDELIRELVRSGRPATADEIRQIVNRMAMAPFDPSPVSVRVAERGIAYLGMTLGARAESLTYHLIKRVIVEEQWAPGTTATRYVSDLRRAVRAPLARLAVYERRGGYLAATVTPTNRVVPPGRLGAESKQLLLVVYSADRGIMLSGYQFSDLSATGIPGEARWLT